MMVEGTSRQASAFLGIVRKTAVLGYKGDFVRLSNVPKWERYPRVFSGLGMLK